MMYNFYIYNRKGKCLYYREWNRPLNTLADDPDEEKRLMFGMLFSLKDLTSKLSPTSGEKLNAIRTNSFVLHHFESGSGLVFLINTKLDAPDMYPHLQYIYANIFTEFVARNPLYRLKPDEPLTNPLFAMKVEEYLLSIPAMKQ